MVAQACGTKQAVATSSGTSALHVMLAAIGVGTGDLVLMPALTFIATANAISYTGAKPVFIDVSADSWTLDPQSVAGFLEGHCARIDGRVVHQTSGQRVAAVMCVHTLGHPAEMDGLQQVADAWSLPLLGDAAAALGALYRGREVTSRGYAAALSFNGNKTVTCGGGGAVVSQDEAFLARVRHLSTTARSSRDYDHDQVGFNYRMTNLQAAVGCAQMERVRDFVRSKTEIAHRYQSGLRGLPDMEFFPEAPWGRSAHWFSGFLITEKSGMSVGEIVAKLNEAGIGARAFWKPIHFQQPYSDCIRGPLSVSENIWHRVVTLPCSTNLPLSDQDAVIDGIKRILVAPSARPIAVPSR